MENQYEQFVKHFRDMLITVTGYTEDKVYVKSGKDTVDEDRMFVEFSRRGGICQVCALHTKELFDLYCEGTPIEEIVRNSVDGIELVKKDGLFEKALLMEEYKEVKDDLFIRLLNWENNKYELKDAVYRRLGDIAMVLYLRVSEIDDCLTSLKVKKHLLQDWNLKEKEVFEKALLNTYFMSPPRMYQWEKMLGNPEYSGDNFMNICEEYQLKKDCSGNCLSTTLRTNGAVAIFLPGVAQRLAYLMGHDFYVVFTSIHEAMIHNDQEVSVENLKHVLRETIEEATPEEDFLTYRIYHYNSQTGQFTFE